MSIYDYSVKKEMEKMKINYTLSLKMKYKMIL